MSSIVDTQNWVSIPCPLAQWTHDRGKDSRPSAGISVADQSIFNCFSCHKKGTLSWLLRQLERYTGEEFGGLISSLEEDSYFGGVLPEWGGRAIEPPMQALDAGLYLSLYDSAVGHPYLLSRGVSRDATTKMQLLFDPGDGGDPRIVFPVFGLDGLLYGFSGRAIEPKAALKVKDYYGLPKRKLLLGAHLLSGADFVILVEGLLDYAKLVTYGLPAVAMMGSSLTQHQADILLQVGKPVYIFHDQDSAGIDARDRAGEMLCRHLPTMKVRYPKESTVETPEGGLRPPVDPAELTKAQALGMLRDARLI